MVAYAVAPYTACVTVNFHCRGLARLRSRLAGLGSRCTVRLQRHLRPMEARQGRWRARARQTLESARIDEARAVAVLTQDDVVNIETGIVLQNILGHRRCPSCCGSTTARSAPQ